MKCNKCNFTTFDGYEFCPNCNNDFSSAQKKLHIIPYNITDENNYLIEVEEPVENNIEEIHIEEPVSEQQEQSSSEDIESLLDTTAVDSNKIDEEDTIKIDDIDMEIEHNKADDSSDDDSISLDDINLDDLLETNRED